MKHLIIYTLLVLSYLSCITEGYAQAGSNNRPECLSCCAVAPAQGSPTGCWVVCTDKPYQMMISAVSPGGCMFPAQTGYTATFVSSSGGNCFYQVVFNTPGTYNINGACFQVMPHPQAIIANANPIYTCKGVPVSFINGWLFASNYSWDFGDPVSGPANTSSSPGNPVIHTYNTPGTYTVTLVATNSFNGAQGDIPCCSDTTHVTVIVDSNEGPIVGCLSPVCDSTSGTYCILSNPAGCTYTWSTNAPNTVTSSGNCATFQWNTVPLGTITLTPSGTNCCPYPSNFYIPIMPSGPFSVTGNSTVCAGAVESYNAPAIWGATYSWTISPSVPFTIPNPANPSQIAVNWPGSGTYTITCNMGNDVLDCDGVGTITVNVLPKFQVNGPSKACVNQPVVFTSTATTGTTTWTPTTGCTPSGSNFNCAFSTPGTYTITASNPNYCNTPSATIVVAPQPATPVLSGPAQVLPGCTYTYSATGSGPITWTVSPVTAMVVNAGNSIQVTWPPSFTSGTVSAIVTQDSCPSPSAVLPIGIIPQPTITGGGNLCSNGQNSFSISSLPANTTVNWTVSPSTAGSITAGQGTTNVTVSWYTVTSSTPVTVTATITNGCTNTIFATLNATGNLLPEPVVSISGNLLFCTGSNTTITASGGTSYVWDGSLTGNSQTFNTPGQHFVEATNSFGCKKKLYFTLIEVPAPVVTLSTTSIPQCVNSVLQPFTLATTVGSGYTVTSYHFKDPNGNTLCNSLSPTCSVSAPIPGVYTVTVTFSYTYNGSPVSCTKTASVSVACPTSGGPGSGCSQNPNNCTYTITPTYLSCNTIQLSINPFPQCGSFNPPDTITLYWGDGNSVNLYPFYNTSTSTYVVTHTYSLPSYYHILLDCGLGSISVPVGGAVDFNLVHDSCSIDLLDFSSAISGNTFTFTSVNWGDTNIDTFKSHVYANSGTYVVTLTYMLNGNPCTATDTIVVVKPNFSIVANPNPACAGSPVTFSAALTSPFTTANVAHYDWDFGDTSAHSHDSVVQHSYTHAGTHTVSLTITDIYGCSVTKTLNLVTNAPVAYTLTHNSPQCDSVILTISTPSGFGNPTSVAWSPSVTSLGGFQYSAYASGLYTAIVAGPNGCPVTLSQNVTVYPKPNISIIAPDSMCTGQTYAITSNGSSTQFSFSWQINGISTAYSQSGTNPGISFTPTTSGTYELVLTATLTSAPFCAVTIRDTVTVFSSPTVTITPNTTSLVCQGTPVTLNTTVTGSSPFTYGWNNGQTTANITVFIAGNYSVTVTDVNKCKAKATTAANIAPLPDFTVFVRGCDTLCFGNPDTIHGPAGYSNYQFLIDNTTVQNGSTSYLADPCGQSLMADGAPHIIKLIITTVNNCIDSSEFELKCKNCNSCVCDTSVRFNSSPYISYLIGEQKKMDTGICNGDKLLQLECNKKYQFAISFTYPPEYDSCNVKDSAVITDGSGSVIFSQASVTPSSPLSFAFTNTGKYCITHYLKVNGKVCDSCTMCFEVNCSKCVCTPEIHFSSAPYVSYMVNEKEKKTDSSSCKSSRPLPLVCKRPYQFAIAFTVPPAYDTCRVTDSAVITDGLGNAITSMVGVTPSNPLTYTFTQSGTYCITFYLKVNGKVCDSCRFCVEVSCPVPPPCNNCLKILNSSYFELGDTLQNNNGYQVLGGSVNFSTLADAQEVKMSITDIEYSWSDPKCQDCHMHTIGRGCLYATSATQTIGGLILDPNSAQFLPLGSKPNECPEEVLWIMGTAANAGTYNVPVQFSLPQGIIPTCCSLKVTKLCIRLSIKDINCNVCDTIICFTSRPACCKGSKWVSKNISWQGVLSSNPGIIGTGSSSAVTNTINANCGQTYTIADGVTYTFNASYQCNPAQNCTQKMKVSIKQPNGTVTTHNMPYNKAFTNPGTYTITYYAYCGNVICDSCVFKLFLEKDCCKKSKWTNKKITFKKANGQSQTANLNDGNVINSSGPATVSLAYQCGEDCSPTYKWKRWRKGVLLDSGAVSTVSSATFTYNPPASNCDSIAITVYCDGKPCETISFWLCCINCTKNTGSGTGTGNLYDPVERHWMNGTGTSEFLKTGDNNFYSLVYRKP